MINISIVVVILHKLQAMEKEIINEEFVTFPQSRTMMRVKCTSFVAVSNVMLIRAQLTIV